MDVSYLEMIERDLSNSEHALANSDPHLLYLSDARISSHIRTLQNLIDVSNPVTAMNLEDFVLDLQNQRVLIRNELSEHEKGQERKLLSAELNPETVIKLRKLHLPWAKIGAMFGLSRQVMYNYRKKHDIHEPYAAISDDNLLILVGEIAVAFPDAGVDLVLGAVRSRGLRASRKRVWVCLQKVDPLGIAARRRSCIVRRVYHVQGSNFLWCMDANEKLVHWRFYFHGCIDAYSRKLIYVKLAHSKKADEVLNFFVPSVLEHGFPLRVRGDRGTENVRVRDFMEEHQIEVQNPFIVGRSVHNSRIERLWRELNRLVIHQYKALFLELEEEGLLDEDSLLDLLCLSYIYFPRINASLQQFVSMWNEHPLRTCSYWTPDGLWSDDMFEQKRSQDYSLPYYRNAQIMQNSCELDNLQQGEIRNDDIKHLQYFSDQMQEDDLVYFMSIAKDFAPNPLIDDGNCGQDLYIELRNHVYNELYGQ